MSSSDRAGGFLRAAHIENSTYRDVLVVTIRPQAGSKTEFHVTAETYGSLPTKDGPPATGLVKPSDQVMAVATLLLSRCSTTGAPPATADIHPSHGAP